MEIYFVKSGNVNMVKLIKNVNKSVSKSGNTLLHKAVEYNQKEIVKILLEKGADVYAKNDAGDYPIYHLKDRDITEMILNAGFDINKTNPKKQTLLHIATMGNLLEYILEKNPENIDAVDIDGNTPLHQAVLQIRLDNVKILVKHKALLNLKNKFNASPLEVAKYAHEIYGDQNSEIITFLTQALIDERVYLPLEPGEECAICLEELSGRINCFVKSSDQNYPCNHKFHCDCIIHWNKEGKITCPLCRGPMKLIKRFYTKTDLSFGKRKNFIRFFKRSGSGLKLVNGEISYLHGL
jgi:ankyrin repeat protein